MPGEWSYTNNPDENIMIFACKDNDGLWAKTNISKAPLVQYMQRDDIYELIVQEVIRKLKNTGKRLNIKNKK